MPAEISGYKRANFVHCHVTERHGPVVNTPPYSRGRGFKSRSEDLLC